MKNKDREIGNLNTRIEEIKGQSERDRMILLDVGFHKSKLRENTILSPEKNKSKIENQQNEENKEKIIQNTPVVMVGFFDSEDIFHKTRLIQNSSDLKIDKNSAEELTKLIKYCNKETLTETGDSICMKKSNKFQQFPEIKSFVISHEDSSSIKIFPSKRKYGSLPDNNLNSINLVIPKIEKRKKKSMKRAKSIDLLNIEKNVVNDRRKLSVENKLESSDNDKKSEKSMEKSITEYSISSDKNSSARSSKKIKYRIIENILKEPVTENNSIDKSRGKKAERKKIKREENKVKSGKNKNHLSHKSRRSMVVGNKDQMNYKILDLSNIESNFYEEFDSKNISYQSGNRKKSTENDQLLNRLSNSSINPEKSTKNKKLPLNDSQISNIVESPRMINPSFINKFSKIKEKKFPEALSSVRKVKSLKETPIIQPKDQIASKNDNSKHNEINYINRSESIQVDINPIAYNEITSPQVHSTMHHLRKLLKEISLDPDRKKNLTKDADYMKRASDLGELILDIFSNNNQEKKEEKLLEKLEENPEENPEESLRELLKSAENKNSQTDVGLKAKLLPKGQNKKKKKKLSKTPSSVVQLRRKRSNTLDRETERLSSQNAIRPKYTSKIPKKIVKSTVVVDEFIFGQRSKKILVTHPGQKLIESIIDSLSSMTDIKTSLSLKSLMKSIQTVYQEKIIICKDNPNNKKLETCMILYDLLMNRYGLKSVAENKFKQIIIAAYLFKNKYPRVNNFAKFLGIEGNYQVEEWNFYLICTEIIEYSNIGKNIFNEDTAIDHYSSLLRAIMCVHTIFDSKLPENIIDVIINATNLLKIDENANNSKRNPQKTIESVNIDKFVEILLSYYIELKDKLNINLFPDKTKEDLLNEDEFYHEMEIIPKCDQEMLKKLFENYFVIKTKDEEQTEKAIRQNSVLSIIVDNDFIDIKEIYNNSQ